MKRLIIVIVICLIVAPVPITAQADLWNSTCADARTLVEAYFPNDAVDAGCRAAFVCLKSNSRLSGANTRCTTRSWRCAFGSLRHCKPGVYL